MKLKFVSFVCLCFLFSCEAEMPEDPVIPDPIPEEPFTVTRFLPDISIDNYYVSDKLLYLGVGDWDVGRYILVFDTESEKVVKEIRYAPERFRFVGKVQDTLYVAGDKIGPGGERESHLILLDLEGEILAEYSSSNSCLPLGYEFRLADDGFGQAVDEAGNFWSGLHDQETYQPSPPFSPELGLMRFNPKTNTCTYWNTNNSSIFSNLSLSIKTHEESVYFTNYRAVDSTRFLMSYDKQGFRMIAQTEPIMRRFLDFRINEHGLSHYNISGTGIPDVFKKADGSDITTGMDTSYNPGYLDYYENPNGRDTYVIGTGWKLVTYSNYDPYWVDFPFISKNGIVLLDYSAESEAIRNPLHGEMYVVPDKEEVLWFISSSGPSGLLKFIFPD